MKDIAIHQQSIAIPELSKETIKPRTLGTPRLLKSNPDYFKIIGAVGGRNGHTGGFKDKKLASRAGRLGAAAWALKRQKLAKAI